jgi:hypothetical protein
LNALSQVADEQGWNNKRKNTNKKVKRKENDNQLRLESAVEKRHEGGEEEEQQEGSVLNDESSTSWKYEDKSELDPFSSRSSSSSSRSKNNTLLAWQPLKLNTPVPLTPSRLPQMPSFHNLENKNR